MSWKAWCKAEIEALNVPNEVLVRRVFKRVRARVRQDGTAAAKAVFAQMKAWHRRDHVAALRQVYLLCLDESERARVRPDSIRRAGDPFA